MRNRVQLLTARMKQWEKKFWKKKTTQTISNQIISDYSNSMVMLYSLKKQSLMGYIEKQYERFHKNETLSNIIPPKEKTPSDANHNVQSLLDTLHKRKQLPQEEQNSTNTEKDEDVVVKEFKENLLKLVSRMNFVVQNDFSNKFRDEFSNQSDEFNHNLFMKDLFYIDSI